VTVENGGWNFGLALTNLGGKIGYTNDATEKDYIPADLGLGASYTNVFDEDNKVMFGLDFHKLLVPQTPNRRAIADSANMAYYSKSLTGSWFSSFSGGNQLQTVMADLGVEYAYQDQFFLRVGYYYESAQQGDLKYFTTGIGLRYSVMELNFSYLVPSGSGTNRNPLSNTLRFGLVFNIDGKSDNSSSNTSSSTQ
jgi:hypothetical protein